MRCPACGHDNIQGEDTCDNCGASLLPSEATAQPSILDRLVGEHLSAVGGAVAATIEAGQPVSVALEQMRRDGLDCLLVVRAGQLVGIFTDRDAVLKAAGRAVDAFDVRDLMTPDPEVLRPDDTLAVAIHKMATGGFRHMPIVGDDGPIGVVAARDVFRHVLSLSR